MSKNAPAAPAPNGPDTAPLTGDAYEVALAALNLTEIVKSRNGYDLRIPTVFAAGHVCSEADASLLQTQFTTTVVGQFKELIRAAAEATRKAEAVAKGEEYDPATLELPHLDASKELANWAKQQELSVLSAIFLLPAATVVWPEAEARGGGAPRLDPVEKAARTAARNHARTICAMRNIEDKEQIKAQIEKIFANDEDMAIFRWQAENYAPTSKFAAAAAAAMAARAQAAAAPAA